VIGHLVIPRGHWYDISVLNVHAATEDKCDKKDCLSCFNWNIYLINSLRTT
jgi:hypothetical protein